jgi:hypothetical protein
MQGNPSNCTAPSASSAFAPGREERLNQYDEKNYRAGVTRTDSSERSDLRPEFTPTRSADAFGTPYGALRRLPQASLLSLSQIEGKANDLTEATRI